jgi:hypothetical protein
MNLRREHVVGLSPMPKDFDAKVGRIWIGAWHSVWHSSILIII